MSKVAGRRAEAERQGPVSYAANENCVRKHLLPSPLGGKPLPDATAEDARAWLAGVPAGAAVKNRALSVLKRSFAWAVAEGLLAENPVSGVRRVRHTAKETPFIPPKDVWRYLRAVEGDPYEALFVVMATSGLRPSELLALRWKDFDGTALLVDESVSYVGGKHEVEPPKTSAGKRRVPLAREAAASLSSRARHGDDALVFPSLGDPSRHYGRHALYHRWEARLKEAGLPRVPLYALRHTAVMLYAAAGTDLKTTQVVMGHSDPGTTLKVYTHFVEERAAEAARNVDALLGPRGVKMDCSSSNGNVKRRKRRR